MFRGAEFHFPFPQAFAGSGQACSRRFETEKYLDRISKDDCQRIEGEGYLKGLIDLTFNKDGKYYLLDWKSNKLGGFTDGFGEMEVEKEMFTHHYVLQYHLYTVALHRFLQSRLRDYTYDRHFGGVYYLFVRGMKTGSDRGIFYDLPDLETVQTLENFLLLPLHEYHSRKKQRIRNGGLGYGGILFFERRVGGEEGKLLAQITRLLTEKVAAGSSHLAAEDLDGNFGNGRNFLQLGTKRQTFPLFTPVRGNCISVGFMSMKNQ